MNNIGMKIAELPEIFQFNLDEIEREDHNLLVLCADAIFLYWLSSLDSLGQLIPRFFSGEREPACVCSAAIFATITHPPGMDLRQKALERHGRVFTRT